MPRKIFIIILLLISLVDIKTALAVFEVDTDDINIDFGFMNIGEWQELRERGTYQNEVKCKSDKGNLWYLKVHALNDFRAGANTMPCSNLKWQVISAENGNGIISNENTFTDFTTTPQLLYTSGPSDSAGQEIKIRLTYAISIPKAQPAGNYRTTIRFTMTEFL